MGFQSGRSPSDSRVRLGSHAKDVSLSAPCLPVFQAASGDGFRQGSLPCLKLSVREAGL